MAYSPKYLDHFTNPRGVGEINPNDGVSEVEHSGEGCFDHVKLTLSIKDGLIANVMFRARACSGTIAACSALVEVVKGKTPAQALALTPDDLVNYLEGVPEKKRHSVEIAIEALKKAVG